MAVSQRTFTTFRVVDGVVAEGGDPILTLLDRGGVLDLLRTCELGDGWYQFDTVSGITRCTYELVRTRKALRRHRTPLRARLAQVGTAP
jgi:hypothetical protein